MAATHPDDPAPGPEDGPVDEPEGTEAEAGDEAVEESPAAGVLDPERREPPEPSEPG